MELSEVKRSYELLLAVLGRDKAGQHIRCSFHDEQHGSMSVWQDDSGIWMWKCHSGCGSGTIIDAAMKRWGAVDTRGAILALEKELGVKLHRDVEVVETKINVDRAERMIAEAHKTLMGDFELQEELLMGKRGIHNLEVVKEYRLGFVRNARFNEWFSWRISGWVLPVTDADGRLLAVKLHQEGQRDRESPKCLWAPFGLATGTAKPKHSALTLWPPPERWIKPAQLWVCPGELKALAAIDKGLPATSSTAGEGSKFAPFMIDRIKACQPGLVVMNHDDDAAGQVWLKELGKKLLEAGLRVKAVSGRELNARARKKKVEPPPEAPTQDFELVDAEFAIAMDKTMTEEGVDPETWLKGGTQ